jgi:hypothetical protein
MFSGGWLKLQVGKHRICDFDLTKVSVSPSCPHLGEGDRMRKKIVLATLGILLATRF